MAYKPGLKATQSLSLHAIGQTDSQVQFQCEAKQTTSPSQFLYYDYLINESAASILFLTYGTYTPPLMCPEPLYTLYMELQNQICMQVLIILIRYIYNIPISTITYIYLHHTQYIYYIPLSIYTIDLLQWSKRLPLQVVQVLQRGISESFHN